MINFRIIICFKKLYKLDTINLIEQKKNIQNKFCIKNRVNNKVDPIQTSAKTLEIE